MKELDVDNLIQVDGLMVGHLNSDQIMELFQYLGCVSANREQL